MTNGEQGNSKSSLKEEIIRLGPWHLDVQVTPEVSTRVSLEASEGYHASLGEKVPDFLSQREWWIKMIKQIYPEGLEGRTFLECACNCGAYCFWAKEIGASRCFGFDVREHWIEQARFLVRNRTVAPTEGISFETMDLYDLPERGMEPFDVTLFKGIFYHLPDPVTGLKAAADLTKELLILNTAVRTDLPDGMLAVSSDKSDPLMSGVYELNWIPTGPKVITKILNWMGFPETRVNYWTLMRPQENPQHGKEVWQDVDSRLAQGRPPRAVRDSREASCAEPATGATEASERARSKDREPRTSAGRPRSETATVKSRAAAADTTEAAAAATHP